MGYGNYSQDIAMESRSQGGRGPRGAASTQRTVHPILNPHGAIREVNNETPIVVAMDVTRSRGDDTRQLYAQLPKLMKLIEAHSYVDGPGISFAAIGDATVDRAPLQAGQFEGDNRLDEELEAIWIEEGGGGTGQESYELAAWFYAKTNCVRLAAGQGGKGFFFFVGDEGFYPTVSQEHLSKVLGEEVDADGDSAAAFARLHEKFHVFLIYPGKSMEDRKSDIDAEIRTRVLAAGGQHDNVDVRVSLIWDNRNDLDLHVTTPAGEEIYFGRRKSGCGGELDVDRNVQGETITPVENIRWTRGGAPEGEFRVKVRNYRFHEQDRAPTPFRVEVELDGDLLHFQRTISPKKETGAKSDIEVCTFAFDPDPEERAAAQAERYRAYSDAVVLGQWRTVLPEAHILKVSDAQAISDVLLGALAVANGRDSLAGYIEQLVARGGDEARVGEVRGALAGVQALV